MNFPITTVSAAAEGSSGAMVVMPMMLLLVLFGLYLLPSIIALAKRNHRTKVILFNIFLGWTVVMWIISLVWACKRDKEVPATWAAGLSSAEELKKYKDLLDSGVISEEEFEKKKSQLLEM